VFTLLRTFGIGVILATGFVHMFPPADQALTNKCLPEFFTEEYTSFAGLIAMASVLMVQLIQTIAVNHFKIHSASDHSHSHSHNAIVEHSSTDDSGLQRTLGMCFADHYFPYIMITKIPSRTIFYYRYGATTNLKYVQ
jgi:hypothetical protein